MTADTGWVNVGTDADTGQFVVESIRRWWRAVGGTAYPNAKRVLITADSGGSNGSRFGCGRPNWLHDHRWPQPRRDTPGWTEIIARIQRGLVPAGGQGDADCPGPPRRTAKVDDAGCAGASRGRGGASVAWVGLPVPATGGWGTGRSGGGRVCDLAQQLVRSPAALAEGGHAPLSTPVRALTRSLAGLRLRQPSTG